MPTVAPPLPFAANERVLGAVLDELEDLESSSGGVVASATRREALSEYARLIRLPRSDPPRWRHGDAAERFDDLVWSSGRLAVPGRGASTATTLGLVHAGSLNLTERGRDGAGVPRGLCVATLADAMRATPPRAGAVRGTLISPDRDPFTALTTAFQNCGAYVEIPPAMHLDSAIALVWTVRPGEPEAVLVNNTGAGE